MSCLPKRCSVIFFATLWLLTVAPLTAAPVSYVGGTYTQDFNALISTGTQSYAAFGTTGQQASLIGLPGWQAARVSGTENRALTASAGGSGTGALYSYGAASSTERALGSLSSLAFVPGFGFAITNNTSNTYDTIVISFDAEIWRVQGRTTADFPDVENRLRFSYGLASQGIGDTNFITNANMTRFEPLDVISAAANTVKPTTQGTAGRARDGNSEAWSTHVTAEIDAIWAPGDTLYIRWVDFNADGFGAGMAVDNFSMVAIPEPAAVTAITTATVIIALARTPRTRRARDV